MAVNHEDWDLNATGPPDNLSDPATALWWLGKGNWQLGDAWENAHELCQRAEGTSASDWVHALAHWIEGDEFNSSYWYRRAGKRRVSEDARQEWKHILGEIE
jgi:hypothetical protein